MTQQDHMPQQSQLSQPSQSGLPVWSSLALLIALLATCLVLLILPISMPVGAMYRDLFVYLDATQRINNGQIPTVDFFTPVGGLGYYLAAAAINLFPNGHPLLAVSWSILLVTVPVMAIVAYEAGKRSSLVALAITIPFVLFSLLPFNTTPASTFPASDGFALYNRQTSQLLYVIVAAAIFIRTQWIMAIVIGIMMTALFFTKITGFLSAGLVCFLALLVGRIHWHAALAAIAIFVAMCTAAQFGLNGIVSAYIADIATLISLNHEGLLSRIMQSTSKTFGTTLSTVMLGTIIFAVTWPKTRVAIAKQDYRVVLDHASFWLMTVLLAGLFFESQNTGGQELIYLWPVVVMLASTLQVPGPRPLITGITMIFAACATLPPLVSVIQSSVRATVRNLFQEPLQHTHLRQMGNITTRTEFVQRAQKARQIYIDYPAVQKAYIDIGELPALQLFSDIDFNLLLHINLDELVGKLKELEGQGLEYDTVFDVNYTNPLVWLLNKDAPKHVPIVAAVDRTLPTLDELTAQEVSNVDLAFIAKCPFTVDTFILVEYFKQPLAKHRRVELTPCYDVLVHPRVAFNF